MCHMSDDPDVHCGLDLSLILFCRDFDASGVLHSRGVLHSSEFVCVACGVS